MTFPEHIQDAPTPRTDALNNICSSYEIFAAEYEQLERQLIWLSEVAEQLALALADSKATIEMEHECHWLVDDIDTKLSALNEYKQGTKEV